MARKPPAWVVSNEESVRREVERYKDMTPSTRADILLLLCRDGATLAAAGGREEEVRRWRDPLPESSIAALNRLRALYRRAHPEEFKR